MYYDSLQLHSCEDYCKADEEPCFQPIKISTIRDYTCIFPYAPVLISKNLTETIL